MSKNSVGNEDNPMIASDWNARNRQCGHEDAVQITALEIEFVIQAAYFSLEIPIEGSVFEHRQLSGRFVLTSPRMGPSNGTTFHYDFNNIRVRSFILNGAPAMTRSSTHVTAVITHPADVDTSEIVVRPVGNPA